MPIVPVTHGVDPSIADPASPNYNPADSAFGIAQLMRQKMAQMSGMDSQNVDVTEGAVVQIWDIPKGIICFLNCPSDLDEITINTQTLSNVSDAQQMAIYTTHSIGNVLWTGIPLQNAPDSLSATDYWSFRYRAVGGHFIRTVSP